MYTRADEDALLAEADYQEGLLANDIPTPSLDAKAAVPGGDAAQLQDNLDWVEQKILTVYKSPGTKDEQLQRIQGSMHVICAGYDSWKRWVKESDNDVVSLKRRIVELEQRLAPTPSPDAEARAKKIAQDYSYQFIGADEQEGLAQAVAAALTASEAEVIERCVEKATQSLDAKAAITVLQSLKGSK